MKEPQECLDVADKVRKFCDSPEGQKEIMDAIESARVISEELKNSRKIKWEDWVKPFDI